MAYVPVPKDLDKIKTKVAFNLKRLEELDPEGMKRFYKDHPELEEKSQVPKKKKRNQMER